MDRVPYLKVSVLFYYHFEGFYGVFYSQPVQVVAAIFVICWYILSKLVNMILHMSYIYYMAIYLEFSGMCEWCFRT